MYRNVADYSAEIKIAIFQYALERQGDEWRSSANSDRIAAKIARFNVVNSEITGQKFTKFVQNVAALLTKSGFTINLSVVERQSNESNGCGDNDFFYLFKNGASLPCWIVKFGNLNGRDSPEGRRELPCQILLKSVKRARRYGDFFSIFQDGVCPPSWIL